MEEKFNLQEHIAKGVEKIVSDTLKATMKDPRESAFMLKFAAASRRATKIRQKLAENGENVSFHSKTRFIQTFPDSVERWQIRLLRKTPTHPG